MKNSMWQMILTMMLLFVGSADAIVTKVLHPEWFVGAVIVAAIMGLTMELEKK